MPVTTTIANLSGTECGCRCCAPIYLRPSFDVGVNICLVPCSPGSGLIPCHLEVGATPPVCATYSWLRYLQCIPNLCDAEEGAGCCPAAQEECFFRVWYSGSTCPPVAPSTNTYHSTVDVAAVTFRTSGGSSGSIRPGFWRRSETGCGSPNTQPRCGFVDCGPPCCQACGFTMPNVPNCGAISSLFGTYDLRGDGGVLVGSVTVSGSP